MSDNKTIKVSSEDYITFTSEWADDLMKIKLGKDYEKLDLEQKKQIDKTYKDRPMRIYTTGPPLLNNDPISICFWMCGRLASWQFPAAPGSFKNASQTN